MTWNTQDGSIAVVTRRVNDIVGNVDRILSQLPVVTARALASLAGKIISLIPVVGPIAQLKSRFLYSEVSKQNHWDKKFSLASCSGAIEELFFWKNELLLLNKRFLFHYSLPQVIMYSDASSVGCGAWSAQCGGLRFNQNWDTAEAGKSSTWRELKGVVLALQAFLPKI